MLALQRREEKKREEQKRERVHVRLNVCKKMGSTLRGCAEEVGVCEVGLWQFDRLRERMRCGRSSKIWGNRLWVADRVAKKVRIAGSPLGCRKEWNCGESNWEKEKADCVRSNWFGDKEIRADNRLRGECIAEGQFGYRKE